MQKGTMNDSNTNLIKNIGERLQKQKEKDKAESNEDSETRNEKIAEKQQQEDKINELFAYINEEDDEENSYASTYTITPEMDDIFLKIKRKIRRKFSCSMPKQKAIELGLLLLDNLDDNIFDRIADNYSKEDELIEILKYHIKENDF